MSRPRTNVSELTPLFITRIKDFFFDSGKIAYNKLGLAQHEGPSRISLPTFYRILNGENCSPEQAILIEQAAIAWARDHHPNMVKELMLSATDIPR